MWLTESIALGLIALAGLFLIALGFVSLLIPAKAIRFLMGFARSAATHYLELVLRLIVGAALIHTAHRMLFPTAFTLAGWILLITTACLLLVPWRWHRRFTLEAVPRATRFIGLIGIASLAMGGFLLMAAVRA